MTITDQATLADYLSEILHDVQPLPALHLSLLDAAGSRLAEDVVTSTPLPAFDTALVDGYAVRADDLREASSESPTRLSVIGDIGISSWQHRGVPPGGCFAISAGAALPAGADAVVPRDHTDTGLVAVNVTEPIRANENVLWAGAECAADTLVGGAGELLTPGLVGLMAAAGFGQVSARPIPRVIMLAVGDELVDVGSPGSPGHVVDAASYAVTAGARQVGAQAFRLSTIGDDPARLNQVLDDNAMRADLVVVTGSHLMSTIGQLFSGVRFAALPVAPGGLFGFGRIGDDDTPIVCLPGDAAAAFIGFELIVRPLIQRLAGADQVFRRSVKASLTEPVESVAGKREFRPCALSPRRGGGYAARPLPGGSRVLTGLARANGLLVLSDQVTSALIGSPVDVLMFE